MRSSFQYSNHSSSVPGADKELHLHLFEFAHAENKLAGHDLVAESFAGLCNAEWDFHPAGFLHIQEIDKNTLGCFRTEVNHVGILAHRTHLGGEHQVELAHIGPVAWCRKLGKQFPDLR